MIGVSGVARSRFAKDAVTLQAGVVLNSGSNLIASLLLAHLLGARMQGVYVVALSLYALLFFLINLGVQQGTVSQVAKAAGDERVDKVGDWLAFLFKAYVMIGSILALLGWFVLPHMIHWWEDWGRGSLAVPSSTLARWAWWLTFIPLIDTPRVVAVAAFQGTRRMVSLVQLETTTELVRAFLVIVGALVTNSAEGAVIGTVAAYGVGSFLAFERYLHARNDGGLALPSLRQLLAALPHVSMARGMWLGIKIGVLRQADALSMTILPPLIIQTFGSSAWVAYFRVAQSIMVLPFRMMQGLSRTALPAFSQLAGAKDMVRFRLAFRRVTFAGGGLITSGILLCLPMVPILVHAFYPADYAGPVWSLASILSIGFILASFMVALDSFYIVTQELKMGIVIMLVGMVVTLPITILLCWRFPETGIAWGMVVAMSWGLVHYLFVFVYFRDERHLRQELHTA